MQELIRVFHDRKSNLLSALFEHMELSFIALFFAVAIAIPLGIFLTRRQKVAEGIIGFASVIQTIPSLALLGILIPLFGIGRVPALIALVAYALLPILRNTYTGIKEVEPALIESCPSNGDEFKEKVDQGRVAFGNAGYDGRHPYGNGVNCRNSNSGSVDWSRWTWRHYSLRN